ncbi:AMP-binding protein [Candidatus Igneacidithiobacillus taiwanensis]|uniref:AMP-binding protein n=1 Tax=Candidatus Igneacidithiobacillus taiwanensis TaxID=1945924 RepID=UPI002896586C|nr:AMP-binding protein [Candidatus Igneacidithiobacillus taiwanensis]
MTPRAALLQALRDGLESGFCLDWRPAGVSRAWPGPALLSWALRLRQRWRRQLPPRARIAVRLPNSPAFVAHWLAALQGDWIFCPLPELDAAEAQRRLQMLRPQLIVSAEGGQVREYWPENAIGIDDPEDLALILWTSASMGPGSAFGLSHAALLWQLRQHAPALALGRDSLLRNVLPWSHVFAGVLELLPALTAGAELRVAPLQGLRHEHFTHLCAVPRVLSLLSDTQIADLAGGNVGGAAVDASLAERLQGSRLRVGYGQTEAGPGVMLGPVGSFSAALVGKALPEVEINVAETLHYRSPGQALGRWDGKNWLPVGDAEGWIDSGDRLSPLPDGNWRWCGRRDARFKLADGRGVQPEEEELRLQAQYPGLQQVIIGAPGQRRLAAFAAVQPEDWAALHRQWRERYPLYGLAPEEWRPWQGPTGKLRRGDLYADWQHALAQARRA